jgi:hypothetical protein
VTQTYRRPDLYIDQTLALAAAAQRLAQQFDGIFGTETIERFLHTSFDQFAGPGHGPQLSAAASRAVRPPAAHRAGPGRRKSG